MSEIPPFNDAVETFKAFLASQGHERELAWVFLEDVLRGPKRQIWVRWPLPGSNGEAASIAFERARHRGLGVNLGVLCRLEPALACYVWSPQDEEEWETALISKTHLKLTVPTPLCDGVLVTNSAAWVFRQIQGRRLTAETIGTLPPARKELKQ